MQRQIFLEPQRELQTRFIDAAERGILRLNFASDRFTNGKFPIAIELNW